MAGYNYSPQRYVSDHKRVPSRVMVGTESFPKDSFQMFDLVWSNPWVIGGENIRDCGPSLFISVVQISFGHLTITSVSLISGSRASRAMWTNAHRCFLSSLLCFASPDDCVRCSRSHSLGISASVEILIMLATRNPKPTTGE